MDKWKLDLLEVEPAELAKFAFGDTDTFWLAITNVDWMDDAEPPLHVAVIDATTGSVLHRADPIGELIGNWANEGEAGTRRLERAIQALQSGIDRIRASQNGKAETT
jgi:hypothetical protein